MQCPSCFIPDVVANYSCSACSIAMCENCVTFALHCGNIVCLECDKKHQCDEPVCEEFLLLNMTVSDLLRVYCGESLSSQTWSRIGTEYSPDQCRISQTQSTFSITGHPFTFTFPEIQKVRVYNVSNYTLCAKWVWRQIREANSTKC